MNGLNNKITEIFDSEKIEYVSALPYERCRVVNPRAERRIGFKPNSVIVFAVPYFTGIVDGNISAYARAEDYHIYFSELFLRVIPKLEKLFSGKYFKGFADSSPIDEVQASSMASLGVVGENSLLITEKYSSFVFLGEIFTDTEFFAVSKKETFEYRRCEGCGACKKVCPAKDGRQCLSAVTQKKGTLNEDEKAYLRQYGSAWGCDLCQNSCPHTKRMIKCGTATPIRFFYENRIEHLNLNRLDCMSEGDFSRRAYSWRGRETVERNLEILEKE